MEEQVRVLGPIEVWSGETRVQLGGRMQRAVLARLLLARLLLAHGETVSADR